MKQFSKSLFSSLPHLLSFKAKSYSVLLFSFVFFTLSGYSQTALEWAPIGAEWHYQVSTWDNSDYGFEYIKVERDTVLVEGKSCKVFEREFIMPWGNIERNSFVLCEQNGLVEHYLEDQLYTLYDFNAQIGDQWNIILLDGAHELSFMEDANGEVTIDSISLQQIGGVNLKKIHLSLLSNVDEKYLTDWLFSEIVEIIGSNTFIFPKHNPDFPNGYKLNCYSDQNITYKNSDVESQCREVFTSLKEVQKGATSIEIFPNPSIGSITLSKFSAPIQTIRIYSLIGKQVASFSVDIKQETSVDIDLSFLPEGTYFLNVLPVNRTTYQHGQLFSIIR
ncbi:MAG: T9SS type A sorting domain-containing protein [Bacteroidota bacterium]